MTDKITKKAQELQRAEQSNQQVKFDSSVRGKIARPHIKSREEYEEELMELNYNILKAVEDKKEVRWYDYKAGFDFNKVTTFGIEQLFDAYQAQKVELEKLQAKQAAGAEKTNDEYAEDVIKTSYTSEDGYRNILNIVDEKIAKAKL